MVRVNWAATFCCHCYPTILFFCNVRNPLSHSHHPMSLSINVIVPSEPDLLPLVLVTFRLLLVATHSHPPVATYIGDSSLFVHSVELTLLQNFFSFMIFHEKTSLLFSFFWLDLFPISDSFLLVLGIDNSFLFEIKLFKAITTKEKIWFE